MSLFVHPDDQEAHLVPRLCEAAAWLASMSPAIFQAVMGVDPKVLLGIDAASTDVEVKADLIGTLLWMYEEERLLDVGWVPRACAFGVGSCVGVVSDLSDSLSEGLLRSSGLG